MQFEITFLVQKFQKWVSIFTSQQKHPHYLYNTFKLVLVVFRRIYKAPQFPVQTSKSKPSQKVAGQNYNTWAQWRVLDKCQGDTDSSLDSANN